jgi:hypothetical protein
MNLNLALDYRDRPLADAGQTPGGSASGSAGQALSGLAPIGLADSERFATAAEDAQVISWSHFFPYLYFAGRPEKDHRLLHEFVDGAALVYRLENRRGKPRLSLLLAPFPFSLPALRQARDRMRAFNGPGEARIIRLQESEALPVARQGFEIYHHSDEYLYDGEAVARLHGAPFATVRRKIARYAGGSAVVRDYRAADEPACRALLDAWHADLGAVGVRVGPYYRYSRTCLGESNDFPSTRLIGQVIEVEGVIGAFTFGGCITTTHASIFITVADRQHPGLAYFQRKSLIDGLRNFRFFNDAHDSKRPGLAQMKRSFRPAAMHSLFGARQG